MRLAATVSALSCLAGPALAQPPFESYAGTWVSPAVEPVASPAGGTAYLRRSVTFTEDIETLQLEAFADAEATQPLFTYQSSGPYKIGAASTVVPGAWEIDLSNDSSQVTIFVDAPDLWQALNFGACPLVIGTPVEISGCVSGPPFIGASCTEMDLLGFTETELRFGTIDTDRCATRPVALDDSYYVRPTQP